MCFKTIRNFRNGMDEIMDSHPKITAFYRSGLLKRVLVFVLSLPLLAICLAEYYWIGFSFSEGEGVLGFFGIILGAICIALFAKYLMYFSVLGFSSAKLGIKHRVQSISNYMDDLSEEEKEEQAKKNDMEDFKPHTIFDTIFGIIELIFFVCSTLGLIVIPLSFAVN